MRVGLAYCFVVLIWSTTPLAIRWSISSLSFSAGISLRIFIALVICGLIQLALRQPLIKEKRDWQVYLAGTLGIFPNMLLVYWCAQHIPSGLAAVIFGLYPFSVGLFSYFLLKENIFNFRRVLALAIALCGLILININQFHAGASALYGSVGMLISTLMFGLSSVWLKRIGGNVEPLRQSTGVFLLAAPLLGIAWLISDGQVPQTVDARSISGVLYLAIAGSVLGGTLYFYVLQHCRVASVGLITFFSPILALVAGAVIDGERFTLPMFAGCVLVLFSLAVYQNVFVLLAKYLIDKKGVRQNQAEA